MSTETEKDEAESKKDMDSYYSDDSELNDDELDLSFLDEEDTDNDTETEAK